MLKQLETISDLIKAKFKPIDLGKSKHLAAIGRLVVAVGTHVDGSLTNCLRTMVNTGDESVGRVLIGEMRTGDVMASIRKIARTKNLGKDFYENLDELYSEIETLRHARDIVAHRACWVRGNSMAFHNALIAKTDTAIEVTFFTVPEVNEFSEYAKRLGQRIVLIMPSLTPAALSPQKTAIIAMAMHTTLQHVLLELVKSGKVKGEKAKKLQELNRISHEAIQVFTNMARATDFDFAKKLEKASETLQTLTAAIVHAEVPSEQALREIPLRLRKTGRIRRKGISQAQVRQLPASRK